MDMSGLRPGNVGMGQWGFYLHSCKGQSVQRKMKEDFSLDNAKMGIWSVWKGMVRAVAAWP